MTKQEILDYFSLIDFAYNESGRFESLSRMIDELLKEQEAVKPKSKSRHGSTTMYQHFCGNCMAMLHGKPKYCPNCGRSVKWE